MSAPITERLNTALRTHSLRQDAEGLKVWLLETDVAEAAAIITGLTAALEGLLGKYQERVRAFDCPIATAASAAIAKAKGGAA